MHKVTDIAIKGLPFVVSLTVDPEKQVRDLAFQVLNEFLKVVSEASEQPNFNEIINGERNIPNEAHNGNNQTDSSNSGNSDYFS